MQEPFLFKANARLVDFMRQADEPGLVALAAGVPGLDALPLDGLRESFEEAFAEEGAAALAYHHPEGDHALRALLAGRLEERGVAGIKGDDLVTTTGCTQALQGMLSILVQPGDVVACEAPAYYGLLELMAEAGARALLLPVVDGGGIDPEMAREAFARWKPKCLVVCTSLSNPSGATLPQKRRERLVEVCREAGVRLIEDDIYSELVDGGAPKLCRAYDDGSTVSVVSSFSKSVAPGLRVGYCVPGTAELHDAFAARKTQQDLHSAVITEVALRKFIEKGRLDPHLAWLRERNKRRRELGLRAIAASFPEGSQVESPVGGYMLWVSLAPEYALAPLRTEARKEGIVFAGGDVFYAGAAPFPAMRLNCAKASEPELERGIMALGRLLQAQATSTAATA